MIAGDGNGNKNAGQKKRELKYFFFSFHRKFKNNKIYFDQNQNSPADFN